MRMIDPNDVQIHLDTLPPVANNGELAAMDTEFFGMNEDKLHRPSGTFASLAVTTDGINVYMIFDETKVADFLGRVENAVHTYHNAQFDIRQLRRYASYPDRNKLWDTFLIEKIRFSGLYSSFGLNDLARRYLDLYLPKDEQKSFEASDRMNDNQIFYAACDVISLWEIAMKQRAVIDDNDLNIWTSVERPFLWVLLSMGGIHMDVDKWTNNANINQTIADDMDKLLPFNPRSHVQIKKYFEENYRRKLSSTAEGTLLDLVHDSCETLNTTFEDFMNTPADELVLPKKLEYLRLIRQILAGREARKAASTYGIQFLENHLEEDGCIYPAIHQIGAETGRTSSSSPNIQNIPHDSRFRECFIPGPNHIFNIADYSSQEPRILAYLSQDEELMDVFNSGHDIYIEAGFRVFHERFTKSDARRKYMKAIVLGIPYGMSAEGLAAKMGVSTQEAVGMLKTFFGIFPKVEQYINDQEHAGDYVETILGRKIWLNKFTNQWVRNAKNAPIQGSAADCTKRACSEIYKRWGSNPIAFTVHDEIGIETDDLPEINDHAKIVLERSMVETAEAMHPGVGSAVEIFTGMSWAVKS